MNTRLTCKFLSLVAVFGASAAVADYTPYHELRQDFASIDAAVAEMPSSDLHGTLNRISSIFTRSAVRDLDANQWTQLPPNFADSMGSALADLQADWVDGTASLSLEEKLVLIQTIEVIASSRLVELYNTQPPSCPTICDGPCPPCFELNPTVIQSLNAVVSLFRADMDAMIAEYNAATDSELAPIPSAFGAGNFDTQLDRIRVTFLTIKGVESIDD